LHLYILQGLSPIHDSDTTSRVSHDDSTTANTTPRTGRSPRSPSSNGSNTARSNTITATTTAVQQSATVTSVAANGGNSPSSVRASSTAASPRAVRPTTATTANVAGSSDSAADDVSVFSLPAMTVQVKKELPTTVSAYASVTGSLRSRQRSTAASQSSQPTSPPSITQARSPSGKTTLLKSVQKVMATTRFDYPGGRILSLAGLVQYLVSTSN
jgi:hypothetical protein